MNVRHATYQDIPRIMDICQEAHSVSQYADYLGVDARKLQKSLQRMITKSNKNTAVFVLVNDEHDVHGLSMVISDHYWYNDWKYATDLITYARKSAKGDGVRLYRAMIAWAERMPKVVELVTTISSDIVPRERVERLLELMHFERNGHTFSRYWYDKIQAAQPRKAS